MKEILSALMAFNALQEAATETSFIGESEAPVKEEDVKLAVVIDLKIYRTED